MTEWRRPETYIRRWAGAGAAGPFTAEMLCKEICWHGIGRALSAEFIQSNYTAMEYLISNSSAASNCTKKLICGIIKSTLGHSRKRTFY